jgi:hypothetical protein
MRLPRGAFSYFLLGAVRAQVPAILSELETLAYENFPVRTLVLGAFWTEWSELHFTGDTGSRIREHEENCKSQFDNFNNDFSKYRICTYPDSNQWQGSIKDGKSWYVGPGKVLSENTSFIFKALLNFKKMFLLTEM